MARPMANNRSKWLTFRQLALAGCAGMALLAGSLYGAGAQTMNDRLSNRNASGEKSRMLVDAREIVYDRDNDRVTAVGDVQLYYQDRVLEADRVVYDRKTKRVYAEGNAKLTEADGTKSFGDRFDLTDDFKDGFIDSLRVETSTGSRFASPRAERTSGEVTVLDRGTFTACAPCKENPEKPPLWQVRSARIIHNNTQQRVYYENATLEFWGVPIAWIPFFSAPDPTVSRASGLLSPRILNKTNLGFGVGIPMYWAIAPNYDITFTPTYFERQGLHGDLFWRHRLDTGSYNIRVNGIKQREPGAFPIQPYSGAGRLTYRGAIESSGKFYLNEKWQYGWDVAWASDKFYFTDYKTKPQTFSQMLSQESISKVYLRGRGERSWFDATAYHFVGLGQNDWSKQSERVPLSLDFDRRFTPQMLGGEVKVVFNSSVVQREAAIYSAVPQASQISFQPSATLYHTNVQGAYYPCRYIRRGETVAIGSYRPGDCLLKGFAGDYVRNSAEVSWRRNFIDSLGQEWTPFVSLRADASWLRVNTGGINHPDQNQLGFQGTGLGTTYGNNNQSLFFGGNADNAMLRAMPTIGVEYRYPFFAMTNWGTHYFEPIGQLLIRPNESRIGNLPNEDAQSLVFDEHTIFSHNKFSGFDRVEGGSRLNYGARYTFRSNGDLLATVVFGQSIHLFGRNSYAQADLSNTGRNSGLETRRSDYVAAVTVQPDMKSAFTARGRFDEKTLALRRADLEAVAQFGPVSINTIYSRIGEQPELGYPFRREGLLVQSSLKLPMNWQVSGGVLYDLDRYLSDKATAQISAAAGTPVGYRDTPWRVSALLASLRYVDECTDFSINYTRSYNSQLISSVGAAAQQYHRTTQQIMFRLELRDLGGAQFTHRTTSK